MARTKSKTPPYLGENLSQIKKFGLQNNISDLEINGFTIIPPKKVASTQFLNKMRKTVLRICHERTGKKFDINKNGQIGKYKAQPQTDSQFLLYYLLMADPIFEKWLLNPTLNAMMDYLMKGTQQLSSMTSFIKWQGEGYGETLGLHSDTRPSTPEGLIPSSWFDVSNSTYCLTDYTKENGAMAMVPGSHRLYRQPKPGEGVDKAVPVEAKAGSLIIFNGGIWHGAFPKKTEGLRLNVTSYFCHRKLKTQEAYQWRVTRKCLIEIQLSSLS
ncbi:MAG: hypothetical protein CM1200mP12_02810 [Gammaproteobacteria bacterium]|nr:MAG: hypothetical protein CM1200mP12_02810 [Gammaproteobacteria bacterium]